MPAGFNMHWLQAPPIFAIFSAWMFIAGLCESNPALTGVLAFAVPLAVLTTPFPVQGVQNKDLGLSRSAHQRAATSVSPLSIAISICRGPIPRCAHECTFSMFCLPPDSCCALVQCLGLCNLISGNIEFFPVFFLTCSLHIAVFFVCLNSLLHMLLGFPGPHCLQLRIQFMCAPLCLFCLALLNSIFRLWQGLIL